MYEFILNFIRAGLLTLATVLTFVPETRDARLTAAMFALSVIAACASIQHSYRQGILGMAPKQIYQMPIKPKANLLELAAMVMAVVAMTVTTI